MKCHWYGCDEEVEAVVGYWFRWGHKENKYCLKHANLIFTFEKRASMAETIVIQKITTINNDKDDTVDTDNVDHGVG